MSIQHNNLPKFPIVKPSLHSIMRARVNDYFKERKISQQGNRKLYLKAVIIVVAFLALYLHLMLGGAPWYIQLIECALLGFTIALVGFNIMHDGGHGSFSKNSVLNYLASYSGSVMGASQFMWNMKHNMLHHTFTNIDGVDDDIEVGNLLRFAPTQPHLKMHRYQHIYFAVLYMQMYVYWVFFSDYNKYFTKKIGTVPIAKMPLGMHFRFWGVKVSHLIFFVILPISALGFLPWLIGFLLMGFVSGFVLSIVFQLAHTVESTHFPIPNEETNKIEHEFAEHQLETTANFATQNPIITWLLGGLNFQVEHHLFPKISHVHYPAISKIVKEVCREHGVVYNEYKTMTQAVGAHLRFLHKMGRGDTSTAMA